jgi:DNA-directed RNA polymerase subunit alpha
MIEIQKPKITPEENDSNSSARFVVEPLERGFGITVGNALRRVLLSALPGAAATGIKINGVSHAMSTIPGVREDVSEIILNIKGLCLKAHSDDNDFKAVMVLAKRGAGVVTAGDISVDPNVEILNPDHYICSLEADADLYMEIYVGVGRGYVSADANKNAAAIGPKKKGVTSDLLNTDLIGFIPIDSIYTPVKAASYTVEQTRVGQNIDNDKLILEVTTNGTSSPREMVSLAAKILVDHFNEFVGLVDSMNAHSILRKPESDGASSYAGMPIEDLNLTARSYNCLKRANIQTVEDLTRKTYDDMLRFRNLGTKSLDEIISKLEAMGLALANNDD